MTKTREEILRLTTERIGRGVPTGELTDDALWFAAHAKTLDNCVYWCARAIAQHETKGYSGIDQESRYYELLQKVQAELSS